MGVVSSPVAEIREDVGSRSGHFRIHPTSSHQSSTEKAHTENDIVLLQEFRILGERTVNDVGEVRLEANMNVAQTRQNFVPNIIAIIYDEVLEAL